MENRGGKIKTSEFIVDGESMVINRVTGESKSFISGIKAAVFIGIYQRAVAKYISKQNFYLGRGFFVYISFSNLDDIYASEAYKKLLWVMMVYLIFFFNYFYFIVILVQ